MPNFRSGRSRTWPMHALTTKPEPRILLMVFALAGDSTITTGLPLGPFLEDFFLGLAAGSAAPSPSPAAGASASASGPGAALGFFFGLGAGAAPASAASRETLGFSSASGSPAFFFGF